MMTTPYEIRNIVIGEGAPKICAPLTGRTEEELLKECQLISESKADLVEWRVDFFENGLHREAVLATLEKLRVELGNKPILFSFRTAEEGGEKKISTEEYLALKKAVIASASVDLIDIELFRGKKVVTELIAAAKEHQVLTVISNHDFNQTPAYDEIIKRVEEALEQGADIPKLALMPTKEEDVLTILKANLHLKRIYPKRAMILIAMGAFGVISRFSGEVFGSAITFASVTNISAPGQITVEQMQSVLQIIHEAK